MAQWWNWKCRRGDHNWFPPFGPREFITVNQLCLRCPAERTQLPYGECITGHPIAEHYTPDGHIQPLEKCAGPA